MKSIGVNEEIHKRLKLLSAMTGKKIYELIIESLDWLEDKYRD